MTCASRKTAECACGRKMRATATACRACWCRRSSERLAASRRAASQERAQRVRDAIGYGFGIEFALADEDWSPAAAIRWFYRDGDRELAARIWREMPRESKSKTREGMMSHE